MEMMEYVVVWAPEGGAEEFVGVAESLAEARELVARHEAGDLFPSRRPPAWYDESIEPVEWTGDDGYYAIVARLELP